MTSKTLLLSAAAFAVLLLPGGGGTSFAQQAQQQQRPAAAANSQAPAAGQPATALEGAGQGGSSQGDAARQAAILAVTGVELLRSSRGGRGDIIKVTGVTSSSGWSAPTLIPLTSGTPSDGILDLVFQAETPGGTTQADSFAPIEAILLTDADHPFKGIRVRSATNAITLKTLPGYAEAPAPADPCVKCVGKHFVAKGATAPAGVPAADVVREQDLPPMTRIIKPTDGIGEVSADPNRLTLVIGEDGRVVDAAWD